MTPLPDSSHCRYARRNSACRLESYPGRVCTYTHQTSQAYRNSVIKNLNDGGLDGLVMGQRVGGCGHNLVGANYFFFIGSIMSY